MVTVFFPPRMLFRPPQVKKEITKATALARTQQTSAKKKKAKKATKKPAKKKAKKPKKKAKKKKKKKKKKAKKKKKKKKKKKVTKYPGGKRPKGVHKSKAMKVRRVFFVLGSSLRNRVLYVSSGVEGRIQLSGLGQD